MFIPKKRFWSIFLIIIIIISVTVPIVLIITSSNLPFFRVANAFPNLSFSYPVGLYHSPDSSNRLFVVEQEGVIRVFNNSPESTTSEVFLDIRSQVTFGGEQGLLGLAFHPNFTQNGYFYIDYTTGGNPPNLKTVIARYKVNQSNYNSANMSSEAVILEINQPYVNHNGGQIAFGPDGYFYIALGDGGGEGDPQNRSQTLTTLLGKILRINVNQGSPYSIPSDNPFVGNAQGYREEIWAYGFRNPWRFSFDPVTKWLWAGDVGQDAWEEIDIVAKGKNYGWNFKEGFHCYAVTPCDAIPGLENPIFEYGHSVGEAIIGGFVYRGNASPTLKGKYIYGDFESGRIWALEYDGHSITNNSLLIHTFFHISSFGVDQYGELYFCAYQGNIYKLK